MAARMQQRRGTAAQWTSANPVLGSGEIGFETDTSKFKIGNGTSTWSDLIYFANLNQILDGAPDLLNTLDEIAAAIGDDPSFITTVSTSIETKVSKAGDSMTGFLTLSAAPENNLHATTKGYTDNLVGTVLNTLETVDGEILGELETINTSIATIESSIGTIEESITTINEEIDGIDTQISGITTDISDTNSDLGTLASLVDTKSNIESPTFTGDVVLPTTTTIGDVSSNEISHLNGVTSALQTQIDAKLSSATATSTYAPLNDPTFGGTVSLPNTTSIGDVSSTELGYLDGVTSSIQTQLTDLGTTKANLESPTFTGTVSGVTKEHVGLDEVDNTADLDKPVSDATQDALDLKADLAGATFTGDVTVETNMLIEGNLTITGTSTTISATDLSIADPLIYLASNQYAEDALDVGFLAATGQVGGTEEDHLHSGLFRDVSDSAKWKLVSNVPHPINNVVDVSNASRETLVVGNLEAVGVIFSDGIQTKVGIASLTDFSEKTADYTLDTLSHKDNVVEMNSTSPTTFTIPTNAVLEWPIGASMDIFQTNTGEVTIAAAAGVTLNRTPGNKLRTQWSSATILKRGTDNWVLYGDLKA
jgi:archaellum component FlaC